MDISGSVALVTGANRGLGRHFALQLLERGAAKVYAAARDPRSIDLDGVEPLSLDVTDPQAVRAAVAAAPDLTLLVNNAGITSPAGLVDGDEAAIRGMLETNLWGPLALVRAFAPVLAANGGGAIVDVLSRMSWTSLVGANAYAVTKAAAWSMTNGIRLELQPQGTQVVGVLLSSTDTDMMAGWDIEKNDPADVVRAALDGLQDGRSQVVADDHTEQARAALVLDPEEAWPELTGAPAAPLR